MGDPHANHLGFLKNSDIVSFCNRNYDQKFEFFQLFQLRGILVEQNQNSGRNSTRIGTPVRKVAGFGYCTYV